MRSKAFSGISNFEMHGCPAHDGVYVRVDRRVAGEKGYCKGAAKPRSRGHGGHPRHFARSWFGMVVCLSILQGQSRLVSRRKKPRMAAVSYP